MREITNAGTSDIGADKPIEEVAEGTERRVIATVHEYARRQAGYAHTYGPMKIRQERRPRTPAHANLVVRAAVFGIVRVDSER